MQIDVSATPLLTTTRRRDAGRAVRALSYLGVLFLCLSAGCATVRVTDPPRTATEEFLITQAAQQAVSQLGFDNLRDRSVWVDTGYLLSTTHPYAHSFLPNEVRQPSFEEIFLVAEIRTKLLKAGVRLSQEKSEAQVIIEVRTAGLSVDREEFLLGIPASSIPGAAAGTSVAGVSIATPELAILKSTKQFGFASVSLVAYWADTGELLSVSGPFIGRTQRIDQWILGTGPYTTGDIPPANR